MIIFNTTFLVPDNIFDEWKLWISADYLPFMLRTGGFSEPQLARILNENPEPEKAYSVQLRIENHDSLQTWQKKSEAEIHEICLKKFSSKVLFFSTALEVIDHK